MRRSAPRPSACPSRTYRSVSATPTCLPFGRGAFAARGAIIGANAVHEAAQRLRSRVLQHAAILLQCSAPELDIADGSIKFLDGRVTDLTIGQIARAIMPGGVLFEGEPALEVSCVYEAKQVLTSGFSVHVAKVRLDPCTGLFRIEEYHVTHDAGRALNQMIVDGQIVGGGAPTASAARCCRRWSTTRTGQPLTGSLADYLVATATEIPRINVVHLNSPSSTNAL